MAARYDAISVHPRLDPPSPDRMNPDSEFGSQLELPLNSAQSPPLPSPSNEGILQLSEERVRWRARDASYRSGKIERILAELPEFQLRDLKATDEGPANPFLRSVVRLPRTRLEREIPVGVVSNAYGLAQHAEVAMKCLEGIREAGVDPRGLHADVGLTELGEWMNLRIYFPESFNQRPADKNDIALRLECFNSVDGSSRLVVLLGWIRWICSNGMIIGETKAELREIHDNTLVLDPIIPAVVNGLQLVEKDLARMRRWGETKTSPDATREWVDGHVSATWGKKAASRVFHACRSGCESEIEDPFESGPASVKKVKLLDPIPGARAPAENLYDVSQVLSWVATRRRDPEQRTDWQYQVPKLVELLRKQSQAA